MQTKNVQHSKVNFVLQFAIIIIWIKLTYNIQRERERARSLRNIEIQLLKYIFKILKYRSLTSIRRNQLHTASTWAHSWLDAYLPTRLRAAPSRSRRRSDPQIRKVTEKSSKKRYQTRYNIVQFLTTLSYYLLCLFPFFVLLHHLYKHVCIWSMEIWTTFWGWYFL